MVQVKSTLLKPPAAETTGVVTKGKYKKPALTPKEADVLVPAPTWPMTPVSWKLAEEEWLDGTIIGSSTLKPDEVNSAAAAKPTIIEMLSQLAGEEPMAIKRMLFESLKEKEVAIHCEATVTGVNEDGTIEALQDGEKKVLGPFDSVVLAGGMRPVNNLVAELESIAANVQSVGDAMGVRTVLEALEEGYEAGLKV